MNRVYELFIFPFIASLTIIHNDTVFILTELKPGVDSEELRWNHYNEFVWLRK